ncbi:conjugal transfer protein TraB [Rhizobium sp. BK251]|uniref:conjugal transfer protein TraB n=1 Tax=Rhizobium sp. BK251 TaxID=2512125 RepID=UPI00104E3882|nr:conjugal transfer protein TraB [Rhizobium sp. BK251]TCL66351.1 carbon-nitrogen hydrolase [Rhizobium sp. BK251]
MRRDQGRIALLLLGSLAVGRLGWSGHVFLLPAATFFPAIWSLARTRKQAAACSAVYFLAAARGLPQGVATYYAADLLPGLLLWLAASSGFVFVHATLWTKRPGLWRPLFYVAAAVLIAVPPFGILGWAHPLTAAGILFPGWGWLGLAATATGLAVMTTRLRPVAAIAFVGFWLWSAAQWTQPVLPASIRGVDLQLGSSLGRDSSLKRQQELIANVRWQPAEAIVLLPESAIGFWTPTTERFWQQQLAASEQVVIAGASVIDNDGYDNVLVRVSGTGGEVIYRERMPVPGSMWQPWRPLLGQVGGARAHLFANPVVVVGAQTVAPLICYEQLLVWPVMQSMLHDPDAIIAVGNGWWTIGTSIIDIQKASTEAWARLFDKPLAFSFNT